MRVLAGLDDSPVAADVAGFAARLAAFLGAGVLSVHVTGHDPEGIARVRSRFGGDVREVRGEPAHAINELAGRRDIGAVVVGTRDLPLGPNPVGHVAAYIATHARKPVVVVPPGGVTPGALRRVLVPLESVATARHLEAAVALFLRHARDLTLIVVHVVDEHAARDVPCTQRDWAERFAARVMRPGAGVAHVEYAVGEPAREVLDATVTRDPDLVIVAWSQNLAPERAAVVHTMLTCSRVPVLLMPEIVSLEEEEAWTAVYASG